MTCCYAGLRGPPFEVIVEFIQKRFCFIERLSSQLLIELFHSLLDLSPCGGYRRGLLAYGTSNGDSVLNLPLPMEVHSLIRGEFEDGL